MAEQSALEFASDQVKRFAAALWEPDDLIEVRMLPSGAQFWQPAAALHTDTVVGPLLESNQNGENIYVGANPRKKRGGKAADVSVCRSCFVDFDCTALDAQGHAAKAIAAGLPHATVVVSSGHGTHLYWRTTDPVADHREWTKLQKRLISLLGSDKAIHDPPRIMRLPGFLNTKQTERVMCSLHAVNGTYDLHDIFKTVPDLGPEQTQMECPFTPEFSSEDALLRADAYVEEIPGVAEGGRSTEAFKVAARLTKDFALTDSDAWAVLAKWNQRNSPPLDAKELETILANSRKYGKSPEGVMLAQPVPFEVAKPEKYEPPPLVIAAERTIPAARSVEVLEASDFIDLFIRRRKLRGNRHYDIELAKKAIQRGWDDQEIADLVVSHRNKHDPATLSEVLDPRYVANLLRHVRGTKSVSEALVAMGECDILDEETARKGYIDGLSKIFGINVIRWLQIGEDESARYCIVLEGGKQVCIGSVMQVLANCQAFKGAMYRATRHMIPSLEKEAWHQVTEYLLKVVEVDDSLSTKRSEMVRVEIARLVGKAIDAGQESNLAAACLNREPFIHRNRIHIFLKELLDGMRGHTQTMLLMDLAEIGFVYHAINYTADNGVRGKRSTYSIHRDDFLRSEKADEQTLQNSLQNQHEQDEPEHDPEVCSDASDGTART